MRWLFLHRGHYGVLPLLGLCTAGFLTLMAGLTWWAGAQPATVPPATANLAASHWPKYRHDLWNTGRSATNGPKTNGLKWVFTTGRAEKEGGIETD
ncbi:MAG: hypothetical protein ACREJS_00690, partial [Candidatus Rokuibacteriota bacterium]